MFHALIVIACIGSSPFVVPPPHNSASSGVTATGACATQVTGDVVCYDNNGAAGGQRTADTAPQGLMLRSQPAFPGGTQTASNIVACPGQDETTVAIDGADTCNVGDTVTATVTNSNGASTATILTYGTDWCAGAGCANQAARVTSLTTAIEALGGVGATESGTAARITLDTATCSVILAESDAGCTTVAVGTRGYFRVEDVSIGASRGGAAASTWQLQGGGLAGGLNLVTTLGGSTMGHFYASTINASGSPLANAIAKIDSSEGILYGTGATFILTAGTFTGNTKGYVRPAWFKLPWTNAMVAACAAGLTCDITIATLPAKTLVKRALLVVGTSAVGPTTLTMSVGRTGATYNDFVLAGDIKAGANVVYGDIQSEIGADLTGTGGVGLFDALPSYTATTPVNAHLISTVTDVNTTTGSTGLLLLQVEILP